jgi:hypothetical protein
VKVAIEKRIVVCLAEPEWLHVPFLGSPKTDSERLHDLALKISTLLARTMKIVQLARSPPSSRSKHDANTSAEPCSSLTTVKLVREYESLLSRMEEWLDNFSKRHPSPLYWSTKHPVELTGPSPLLEVDPQCIPSFKETSYQLRFSNGQIAGILMNYWSYQLDLLLGLIELEQCSAANGYEQAKLAQRYSSAREKALLMLETVPYLESCFEGTVSVQASMKTVRRYFTMAQHEI